MTVKSVSDEVVGHNKVSIFIKKRNVQVMCEFVF